MSKRTCKTPIFHGSSTSSCPKSKSHGRSIRLYCKGVVLWNHDSVAVRKVAGPGSSNNGREFFGCPLWMTSNCGFFTWVDEVKDVFRMKEEEITIDEAIVELRRLKEENINLAEKLDKLKKKKAKLEEELRDLKKHNAATKENKIPKIVWVLVHCILLALVLKA